MQLKTFSEHLVHWACFVLFMPVSFEESLLGSVYLYSCPAVLFECHKSLFVPRVLLRQVATALGSAREFKLKNPTCCWTKPMNDSTGAPSPLAETTTTTTAADCKSKSRKI